jgi:pimeloyl-ACP methyl ester carboxylesterase
VRGTREFVTSADGTPIAVLSAGSGAPLLLVHGGMCSATRWAPIWEMLGGHRVSAMDRRGRGASGDAPAYSLTAEFDDVVAVAEHLLASTGSPVDVVGHSYGALCALGAAGRGAPFRRVALYEPPGPQAVPQAWLGRVEALLAAGDPGRAMASFLVEVVGLTREQVQTLRGTPVAHDAIGIVTATMRREARSLTTVDLPTLARQVAQPVALLLGEHSPQWAHSVTATLRQQLPRSTLVPLPGQGHEAIDQAPALTARAVLDVLDGPAPGAVTHG